MRVTGPSRVVSAPAAVELVAAEIQQGQAGSVAHFGALQATRTDAQAAGFPRSTYAVRPKMA